MAQASPDGRAMHPTGGYCTTQDTLWEDCTMATWTPDPTFYPSPRLAMKAPQETLAYVASFDPACQVPDAMAVVDVDPASPVVISK